VGGRKPGKTTWQADCMVEVEVFADGEYVIVVMRYMTL